MSENMIKFIVEKTLTALRTHAFSGKELEEVQTAIAKSVQIEMANFYRSNWNVIVGDNYGSFFTHEQHNMIMFTVLGFWVTVFKTSSV